MKKTSGYQANMVLISTGIVFILLLATNLISNTVIIFLLKHGLVISPPGTSILPFLIQTGVISILTGTLLTLCVGHLPLRPINTLMQAIHSVSEGDFQTKINLEHPKQFKELSRCFNQMTEELSGIEMLRSDFIHNFSHEFKTPMVSILGFAKLLKKGNLTSEEQAEYLDIIIEESERLTSLSANILNLSKVESMSLLSEFTAFNVAEQIREAVLVLEKKWSQKALDFDFHLSELTVTGNEQLLMQVWVNLLDNAIKFSPAGSRITLSVDIGGAFIIVRITDQGIGMDEKTLHCMFDKFYQGDPSHASEGNGLGLALVKKIVELHRGTITAESRPGAGSTFIVTLPA